MQKSLRVKTVIWSCLTFLLVLTLFFPNPAIAGSGLKLYGAVHRAWLDPSPSNPGAGFGNAVAVSGDTLVVGARYDSVPLGKEPQSYSGAAYVFARSGSTWSQQAYLKGANTDEVDYFGCSVAVSGDTVVVGADGEDSSATGVDGDGSDNSAPFAGAAYTFWRSGSG